MTNIEIIAKLIGSTPANVRAIIDDGSPPPYAELVKVHNLDEALDAARLDARKEAAADILGAIDVLDRDCDDTELFRRIRAIVRAVGT